MANIVMTNEELLNTLKGTIVVEKAVALLEANGNFMDQQSKMRSELESYNDDWWKPKEMIQKDDITKDQEKELGRVTRNIWCGINEIFDTCKELKVPNLSKMAKALNSISVSQDTLKNYGEPLSDDEQNEVLLAAGSFLSNIVGEKSAIPYVNKYNNDGFYEKAYGQISAISDKQEKALALYVLSEASLCQSSAAKKDALAYASEYNEKDKIYNRNIDDDVSKFARDINSDGMFPVTIDVLKKAGKQIVDLYKEAKTSPEYADRNIEEELSAGEAVATAKVKQEEYSFFNDVPAVGLGQIKDEHINNSYFLGGVKDPLDKCGEKTKEASRTSIALIKICEAAKKEKAAVEASRMLPPATHAFGGSSR